VSQCRQCFLTLNTWAGKSGSYGKRSDAENQAVLLRFANEFTEFQPQCTHKGVGNLDPMLTFPSSMELIYVL
jgi:hypothetical protein